MSFDELSDEKKQQMYVKNKIKWNTNKSSKKKFLNLKFKKTLIQNLILILILVRNHQ
jgi:hypothetical protein